MRCKPRTYWLAVGLLIAAMIAVPPTITRAVTYQGVQTINLLPNVSRTTSFIAPTTSFSWVLLINYGNADAHYQVGNGPATTNDPLLPVGTCRVVMTGAASGIAVISPGGHTTIRMLQADEQPGCMAPLQSELLYVPEASPEPAAPGAGLVILYVVRNGDGSATLKMKVGTNNTPVDVAVDVGSGF